MWDWFLCLMCGAGGKGGGVRDRGGGRFAFENRDGGGGGGS